MLEIVLWTRSLNRPSRPFYLAEARNVARNGSADRCQDRSIRVPTRSYCDRFGRPWRQSCQATPRDFCQGPARLSPTYWLLPAVPLFSTDKPTNRLIP
jgi:hypothetical protein